MSQAQIYEIYFSVCSTTASHKMAVGHRFYKVEFAAVFLLDPISVTWCERRDRYAITHNFQCFFNSYLDRKWLFWLFIEKCINIILLCNFDYIITGCHNTKHLQMEDNSAFVFLAVKALVSNNKNQENCIIIRLYFVSDNWCAIHVRKCLRSGFCIWVQWNGDAQIAAAIVYITVEIIGVMRTGIPQWLSAETTERCSMPHASLWYFLCSCRRNICPHHVYHMEITHILLRTQRAHFVILSYRLG